MNTKEAIELVKKLYWAADGEKMNIRLEDRDDINRLLKRGEENGKYKQIFNEIEVESHIGTWWEDYIKGKRQKYFLKEK